MLKLNKHSNGDLELICPVCGSNLNYIRSVALLPASWQVDPKIVKVIMRCAPASHDWVLRLDYNKGRVFLDQFFLPPVSERETTKPSKKDKTQ